MRYLIGSELVQLHDAFLTKLESKTIEKSEQEWGYPSGVNWSDTYKFDTRNGEMYVGNFENEELDRWWIPIVLESQIMNAQFPIIFEMNIPKNENLRVSVHYTINEQGIVHIWHKGKFTVGHGSRSMQDFFNYYTDNKGQWPEKSFNGYDYLELGKVHLNISDQEFGDLLESLSEFALYIPNFKNIYR